MWGKMWDILYLVVRNGVRLSSTLCVASIMLPYGSNNCVPLGIFNLLAHGFGTTMKVGVDPVYDMPYVSCWFGGILIQLLH